MRHATRLFVIGTFIFQSACTSIPPYTVFSKDHGIAPANPKVASLIANIKCEFWEAAHDSSELPTYSDLPSLAPRRFKQNTSDDRKFTLQNLFQEIDFIAEAQLTLDVTANSAANPSFGFITPYSAMGASNLTLTAAGQLSDAAHRNITIYTSVDGERLIESPANHRYISLVEPPVSRENPLSSGNSCDKGSELGGNLGIRETIATALIAQQMNDVAVFQKTTSDTSGKNPQVTVNGASAPQQFSSYAFGQIGSQVDFTITEGASGGPNWVFSNFKGPSGAMLPLLNLNRQVKDTLVITVLPVCVRQKYYPIRRKVLKGSVKKKNDEPLTYPIEYMPELVVGTPRWVNYLPPCNSEAGINAKLAGPEKARLNNLSIQGLGILQQGLP